MQVPDPYRTMASMLSEVAKILEAIEVLVRAEKTKQEARDGDGSGVPEMIVSGILVIDRVVYARQPFLYIRLSHQCMSLNNSEI